jgi:hypothetical protein
MDRMGQAASWAVIGGAAGLFAVLSLVGAVVWAV